jgi:hypothetical protein
MRNGDNRTTSSTDAIPVHVLRELLDEINCLNSEYSQNDATRKKNIKALTARIKAVHGNQPYFKKLQRKVYTKMNRKKFFIAEHWQLIHCGFMEIPMSDPTENLTMCMNCRMVPVPFRFPDSFGIGPIYIHCLQNHQRSCHTSGLDLTATVDALDEIIRIEFRNDVNVIKRDTFVDVIRAALIHDTLVTIFTKNVARLVLKKRGLAPDQEDDKTHWNVVPLNAWQWFPTSVDYDAVEKAMQRFASELGNASFQMNQDYPNFVHYLLMISPGLHTSKKFDV